MLFITALPASLLQVLLPCLQVRLEGELFRHSMLHVIIVFRCHSSLPYCIPGLEPYEQQRSEWRSHCRDSDRLCGLRVPVGGRGVVLPVPSIGPLWSGEDLRQPPGQTEHQLDRCIGASVAGSSLLYIITEFFKARGALNFEVWIVNLSGR